MSKPLIFRKANKNDLEEITAMLLDDSLGISRESKDPAAHSSYYKAFEKIDSDPNQELTVALIEDEIIAVFQLTFIQYLTYQGGLRAQVEGVRVKSSSRGQGFGKQIFDYIIKRAKSKGAHLVQLTTDKARPEALRFYERLGFVASHYGMKLHF